MSVRHLLPIALTFLLASCEAALPAPTATTHVDTVTLSDPGDGAAVSPSPSAAPTASPAPSVTARPSFALGGVLGSAQGDFDCDGKADQLQFFSRVGVAAGDDNTLARLVLATGAVHDLPLATNRDGSPLIGTADVNGDGCEDAIVAVGHGASTVQTSFLVYDGNELRLVEEDGTPVMFLFAGSVRHGNAIECRRTKDLPEIVARSASDYTSEFKWDTVEDVHRWATKSRLVLWSTSRSVITVSVAYAMPTDQARYWGISCGNVRFPG